MRYLKTLQDNTNISIQVIGGNRAYSLLEKLGYQSEESLVAETRRKERIENLKTWLEKKKNNEPNT